MIMVIEKLHFAAPRCRRVLRLVLIVATVAIVGGVSSIARADKDDDDKPAANTSKPTTNVNPDEVKLTAEAAQRYGIRVATARKQKLEGSLVVPARIEFNAEAMAFVASAVEGRVTELKSRLGDAVKKGDVLLIVESPQLGEAQSDYLEKRTAVTAAEAAVEPAKSAYERGQKLYDQNQGIALAEVQKRQLDLKTAENAQLIANAARDAAENKLTLMGMNQQALKQLIDSGKIDPLYSVRAPIDGQVIERNITLGELVKPDREKLLVVADISTLWVMADVPEAHLREISVGAKAKVSAAAASDDEFAGSVGNIAPVVDEATRSVRARIEIKGDKLLKPGMFAQATIAAAVEGGDEATVVIPESAIQTFDGSTAVFVPVKGKENTFAKRMVSIGSYAGGKASILSGLNEGEQIVTDGAFVLKADLAKSGAKDTD
jgi:cobalt-zinc-cadmium efflux system membrane fusion protein